MSDEYCEIHKEKKWGTIRLYSLKKYGGTGEGTDHKICLSCREEFIEPALDQILS